jgi:hypothetical protein
MFMSVVISLTLDAEYSPPQKKDCLLIGSMIETNVASQNFIKNQPYPLLYIK